MHRIIFPVPARRNSNRLLEPEIEDRARHPALLGQSVYIHRLGKIPQSLLRLPQQHGNRTFSVLPCPSPDQDAIQQVAGERIPVPPAGKVEPMHLKERTQHPAELRRARRSMEDAGQNFILGKNLFLLLFHQKVHPQQLPLPAAEQVRVTG